VSIATATSTPAFTIAGTSGGIVYFDSATTWASSGVLTNNALIKGGGAGGAPSSVTTGTGVLTALGVNTGSAGAFVVNGGDLGTPSAGVVTNLTGTASININGTVGATTANTGTFSSTVHKGATSGTVTITAPAVAGTQSYTLPSAVPAANGYALTSTTGGVMSWASVAGASAATPTAIGTVYGSTNSGTPFNASIGYNAMPSVTGTYNAACGLTSLLNIGSGSNNAAFGSQSGYYITSGSNNTCLGYNAGNGFGGTYLTTGSFNTYVGYGANPSSATVNYEMSLCAFSGNAATGKGTNTAFIATYNGSAYGSVYQGNNGASWAITSDQRIKKNISSLSDALVKINALRAVEFDYKENDKHDIGFIAQEFEQVFPEQILRHAPSEAEKEWVGEDQVMGVQQNLVPFLVKAVQELSTALDAANARISALEAK
jgi:hypothetical protein